MKKTVQLFAFVMALLMVIGLLPISMTKTTTAETLTSETDASYEETYPEAIDIWEELEVLEDEQYAKKATATKVAEMAYSLVEASATTKEGTLQKHGDMFFWETTDGAACGYSPRLREKIRATTVDANAVVPENEAPITVSYASKGGSPTSTNVALIEPYYGLDSSFTTQYQTEAPPSPARRAARTPCTRPPQPPLTSSQPRCKPAASSSLTATATPTMPAATTTPRRQTRPICACKAARV